MVNGLKMIAIGIALSNEARKDKVKLLNESIEAIAESIRSSSDVDGMPHGTGITDPVSSKAIRMERIELERDAEMECIAAVEWAGQYIRDMFREEDGDLLIQALYMSLNRKRDEAYKLLKDTQIKPSSFNHAKSTYLNQILYYLHKQIK